MKPSLKLGLIGCGRIADLVHLALLPCLPGVELVAVAELDDSRRASALRRVPGAAGLTSYRELLELPALDAVVIALPNALHADAAIAALSHGKHVYLEKPIATSVDDARRVVDARERAGVVGMMGFNYRFNRLYQAGKAALDAGRLGLVAGVRTVFSTASRDALAWRGARDAGGGVLLDLASHHVDLLRFIFAREVQEVFATVRSQRADDDTAMVQLRLAGGLLTQSFFSFSAVEEDRLDVYGAAGRLSIDRYLSVEPEITGATRRSARLDGWRHGMRSLLHSGYLLTKLRAPGHEPSYALALKHFVEVVRSHRFERRRDSERLVSPDFLDGYHSLVTVDAARRSALSGRAVLLAPPMPEAVSAPVVPQLTGLQ